MSKSLKFGYEGEGPMIGRRTAYASYPAADPQFVADQANLNNVDSLYFVIDSNHREFVEALLLSNLRSVKVVTLDYPVENHSAYCRLFFAVRFIRCGLETDLESIPASPLNVAHTYIKMVCEEESLFPAYAKKANDIAKLGHTVLLMPDFLTGVPSFLGMAMMKEFDGLHPRVRVCPPVHHVLRTP